MYIRTIIAASEPEFLVKFIFSLIVLVILFLFLRKRKFWGKSIILIVLVVLMLRMLLFSNPIAWAAYERILSLGDLGYRNYAIVKLKKSSYLKKRRAKYLAVGTSQPQAVFASYSKNDKSNMLGLFSLPGLSPMEYVLYAKYIMALKPEVIILYLSEFDLGHETNLMQLEYSAAEGFDAFRVYSLLKQGMKGSSFQREYVSLVAGSLFPEYKFSFVFKSLLNKITDKNIALKKQDVSKVSDAEYLYRHLKNLKALNDRYVDFHLIFLNEFIKICNDNGVTVVVVEGQYNPLAYTESNKKLNVYVRDKMIDMLEAHENTKYIFRSDIKELSISDFRDGYHVKSDIGREYTKKLLGFLEKQGK